MTDLFDVSTLNWVKGEIDETLKEARIALEKFVENPEDEAQLHFCGTHLHQVAGTLQMVELYGAGQLATEMERLADALAGLPSRESGLEVLMRVLLLLPDYLEVLQTGQPDSPLILLPLLNELRRARGEPELTPASLFQPDLSVFPREADLGYAEGDVGELAQKVRPVFQAALVKLLTGKDPQGGLRVLASVLEKLGLSSSGHDARRVFWVGAGLVEAVRDGFELDSAVKPLFGKFEQVIKQIAVGGEAGLHADTLAVLVRTTLFEIARAPSSGPVVSALKRAYRLESLVPSSAVLDQIRSGMGGFNAELKQTIARDVMEELSRIKDVLDLFSRGGARGSAELRPIAKALTHIAEVLGLVRQTDTADKLRDRAAQIERLIQGGKDADERLLMGVAESVLSVESALSDWGMVTALEKADEGQIAEGESSPEAEAEHRRVVRQVMKIAKEELIRARESINAFISSPSDAALLSDAPRQLHQIRGSLNMLSYRRVAQILHACKRFVDNDLAKHQGPLPDADRLDALADAMMSVEYYLDAFVESRVHPASVLDVAERAVAKLGYPVESLTDDIPPPVKAAPDAEVELEIEDLEASEMAGMAEPGTGERASAPLAAPPAAAPLLQAEKPASVPAQPRASTPAPTTVVDDEIIGIFVEEAEEEFGRINELLPRWRANAADAESLRDLRRSFHTLKGSGRLVGASKLGEFAWAFENLLNRVIDRTVAPGTAVYDFIQQGRDALPELLAEFRGGPAPRANTAALSEAAFALASGAAPVVTTVPAAPATPPAAPAAASLVIEDPVLREIYTKEAEGHLSGLRAFLAESHGMRHRPDNGLLRSLHTLCGSSRTAGVAKVAELAGALEQYVKAVNAKGAAIEADGLAVLGAAGDWVASVLVHLQEEKPGLPPMGDLQSRAAALLKHVEGAEQRTAETPAAAVVVPAVSKPGPVLAIPDAKPAIAFEENALSLSTAVDENALPSLAVDDFEIDFSQLKPFAADETPFAAPGQDTELENHGLESIGAASQVATESAAPAPFEFEPMDIFGDLTDALTELTPPQDTIEIKAPSEEADRPSATPQAARPAVADGELVAQALREEPFAAPVHVPVAAPARAPEAAQKPAPAGTAPTPVRATGAKQPSEDLVEIFANEAGDLLAQSDELIQRWVEQPASRKPIEALQRVLHTLKGSAGWAGIAPMVELGHALESAIAAVVEGRVPVDEEVLHLAQRAQSHLEALLAQLRNGDALGSVNEIVERLKTLAATVPSPVSAPVLPATVREYDADLLNIFLEEGQEILNASDETLQSLTAHPQDRALIERLQRYLHTLKGGARMAGVVEIGDLGHSFESILAGAADGLITLAPPMLSLMQRAQDRLAVMLEQLRHNDPVPSGADLIAELESLVSGKTQPVDVPAPAPVLERSTAESARKPEPPITADAPKPEAKTGDAKKPAAEPEVHDPMFGGDRRTGNRPQFDLVRVRADLLDNMVNVAGEASIFRSRVEQQVGSLGFNLGELDQVIERLRDKLRLFDIETEAQIQSRYEEAATQYEDFDPLEFDRFTHMQQLSRSMMESLGDVSSIGNTLQGITREAETLLVQQARVNTELQEGLMHTRMVPLVQNAPRLRRVVRQVCEELGKEAELRFQGAEVEMDRNVIERIMAPLEHLLRNAVAHGIEFPAQREAGGKPREGTIVIQQIREGGEVVVKVTDDGAGINVRAVREKAIARGLLAANAQIADKEIMLFILESGFSTAESVSQIAGRGVGMDVVNSEVKNLNGSLTIESEPGKGTTFIVRLPLTLTVSRALLVYAGEDLYAVPLLSIEGIVRPTEKEITDLLAADPPIFQWLGHDYRLLHLATVLGTESTPQAGETAGRQSILLAQSGEHRAALVVDGLLGSREIVVKPIGRQLGSVRGLSGATILGDGRVALILELPALIRAGFAHRGKASSVPAPMASAAHKSVVMVVDDSITVRKVTSRLLERNGMIAESAKDGVEALALLEEKVPDVMLLDIEMPRMDGYELATHIRNDARLKHVPIIMITSRSGEKHRQRALQIGVDVYMTKPFQEQELLEGIRALLGERQPAAALA